MRTQIITLPDIGDFKDVPIAEILINRGDPVDINDLLLSVESDKATMEVPSPVRGRIDEWLVAIGDRVSAGSPLAKVLLDEGEAVVSAATEKKSEPVQDPAPLMPSSAAKLDYPVQEANATQDASRASPPSTSYATPSVRAFARELGISLEHVKATGSKGRILKEDVVRYARSTISESGSLVVVKPTTEQVPRHYDFEKFGPVTRTPLSRIQKIAGSNLLASYQTIPHVTNFDRANVSDIEDLRQQVNAEQAKAQTRLTMLAFLIKSSALALKAFPRFNASLDGDELVLKSYINIGFAADTPKGLLVPVVHDAGSKGLIDIARDIQALSQKARDSSLSVSDMQGGTFTVSSLGGIGGDGFTPLINAPEVAILGAGRASTEALWANDRFVPALILPVSLSWDHRVVDGVAAARFLRLVCEILGDFRRAAL